MNCTAWCPSIFDETRLQASSSEWLRSHILGHLYNHLHSTAYGGRVYLPCSWNQPMLNIRQTAITRSRDNKRF